MPLNPNRHPLSDRLRELRQAQGLSLQRLEDRSDGRWKSVVIGSYERGDRAFSIARADAYLRENFGRKIVDVPIDMHIDGYDDETTDAPRARTPREMVAELLAIAAQLATLNGLTPATEDEFAALVDDIVDQVAAAANDRQAVVGG
jgi:transcriptional regulator with XRE-family HTH domain